MIQIKFVRNEILNNIHLPPGVAKIFKIQKIQIFYKSDTDISDSIIVFWSTLEAPSKKTVHFQELLIEINLV